MKNGLSDILKICTYSAFSAILSIFLAGCQTIIAPESPSKIWIPPKWEKTSKSEDEVWKSIRDKANVIEEPLNLSMVIDMSLGNSPSTRQAWNNAKAAEAMEKEALGDAYPAITASADFTKTKVVAHRKEDSKNYRDYGPSVEGKYMLLDFGGRSASIRKAKQRAIAANFDFNQALQDLMLSTETSYYDLYKAKAALAASESDLENAKVSLESAQEKLSAGLGVKLDVLQARSQYDDALYMRESAIADVHAAKANLAGIIGLSADTEFDIVDPSGEMPVSIPKEDISEMIEDALRGRPDIASLRAQLREKEEAIKKANSDLWPTLNIGGSAEKVWYQYFGETKYNTNQYDYTGYLSVDWNIFDGFANYARRNQAKAQAEAQKEALRASELQASTDVWTNYYDFQASLKRLEYSRASLTSSQEAYELALQGYGAGLKNILDLLSAQSQLSDAKSALVNSQRDVYVSLAKLAHSMGTIRIGNE